MGTLAGCQKESFPSRPDNAVSVNFSVGSMLATRSNAAATDASQTKFNSGDQIAVSTNDQEAVIYKCTSTEDQTWTEAETNKFLLWTQSTLTFSAYYPVTDGTSMTAFTLPADQSIEAYINAADYMTVTKTIARPSGGSDISLELQRQTARVIVRISGFNDQYAPDKKTVSNVRIYSAASGIADGNPTGSSSEINPYAQGNGGQGTTYTALVVPGNSDDSADFITLTDGEGSPLKVKGIPEMQAGYSYTFNLTVGKNKIEVTSVTVTDWTTGETLAGGQAEEQTGVKVTAILLNKTETTIAKGSSETLSVSAVTPDNATDQTVTWSSDNTDVATVDATTGEVTAVAAGTANITATANDGSGVTATCAVTVTPATITVTWNKSDITGDYGQSFTKDGITITARMIDFQDTNFMSGGTFTTTSGKFTKIEVTAVNSVSGTGWSGDDSKKIWTGDASSSVSFSGDIMGMGMYDVRIVFTIEPTN